MLELIRKYPQAFAFAVAVHVVLGVLLVVSFAWTPRVPQSEEQQVMQAVTVDEKQVQAELDKIRRAEERKRSQEQERVRQVEERVEKERSNLAQLAQQRKQEAERKKKAESERKHAEAESLKAEQQRMEAERLAEETKRETSKMLEKQRKLEEAEQRRKQLEGEAKRLEQQRSQAVKGEVDKYIALIKARVETKWVQPSNWKRGAKCVVAVRVIPGGEVVEARVTKTCGDRLSDNSVENAVRQASPLPVPSDPQAFNQFRSFEFTFNPREK